MFGHLNKGVAKILIKKLKKERTPQEPGGRH
jgi:hypothetical protein